MVRDYPSHELVDYQILRADSCIDPLIKCACRWKTGKLLFILLEERNIIGGKSLNFVDIFHRLVGSM